ncbi:MAG TPA: hypothetical protein V6D14_06370 [Coleofasciculaceae cyanobacterium]|jgi:hypothetical protein
MELSGPTLRQRLSYGTWAIVLVCTLSVYKSYLSADPLSVAQKHWSAIATENPKLLATRYSDDAVLKRSYGVSDVEEVYQGQSIYSAWQKFFSQYQIKDFQVVKQQWREHSVEAQIQITAQSSRGPLVVLSMSYQVKFDPRGKIIEEVWQANPESSV